MTGNSFREFIACLEKTAQLTVVDKQVDPLWEVGSYLWKHEHKIPPKAVLFNKVKGFSIPVVGGLYSTWGRIALALNVGDEHFNACKMRDLWFKAIDNPLKPINVSDGPVKEVVYERGEADLRTLPIPTLFKEDGGPYITAGIGVSKNPLTHAYNFGIYRMQVIDKDKIHVWGSPVSDLAEIYDWHRKRKSSMDFAVAVGVDPSILFTAVAKIPENVDAWDVAGSLKGEPIKLVRGQTTDIPVPAEAEIVIEGEIDPANESNEGPFAEFGGFYKGGVVPIMQVKAITRRNDSCFHTVISGPSYEHWTLTEQGFVPFWSKNILDHLREEGYDNVLDVNIFWRWVMQWIVISIDKRSDAEPLEVIEKTLECNASAYHMPPVKKWSRFIIVVDSDVDIHRFEEVVWALTTYTTDPAKLALYPDVASWGFEAAFMQDGKTLRIGVDATKPLAMSGRLLRTRTVQLD